MAIRQVSAACITTLLDAAEDTEVREQRLHVLEQRQGSLEESRVEQPGSTWRSRCRRPGRVREDSRARTPRCHARRPQVPALGLACKAVVLQHAREHTERMNNRFRSGTATGRRCTRGEPCTNARDERVDVGGHSVGQHARSSPHRLMTAAPDASAVAAVREMAVTRRPVRAACPDPRCLGRRTGLCRTARDSSSPTLQFVQPDLAALRVEVVPLGRLDLVTVRVVTR